MAAFLLCPPMASPLCFCGVHSSASSSGKDSSPIRSGPPLTSFSLNELPPYRPCLQIQSHYSLALLLQVNLWGTDFSSQHPSCAHSLEASKAVCWGQSQEPTLFVSCVSEVIVLHCLMSSVLKAVVSLFGFLVFSGERVYSRGCFLK